MLFADRFEGGRVLASKLVEFSGRNDFVILALPRGGVPVGYEVARALRAPLDVFVVRKLGTPGQEELAMAALAPDGITVLDREVNWAPGTRLLVGAGGAIALAFPSRNRNIALPSRIIGGLLLARAVTNLSLRRFFGLIRSRREIRYQKTITIHAPRDARVMNNVDEERPPFAFVLIESEAAVKELPPQELLSLTTRIAARYVKPGQANAYGKGNAIKGELLVRVPLTKVVARSGISE
jgi:hypothetical protein